LTQQREVLFLAELSKGLIQCRINRLLLRPLMARTYSDSVPVVSDHHALETAVLGRDLDTRATRIERILQQLLDSIRRSVDDLRSK